MHPTVTNIIAQAHGMNPAPCLCHTKNIYESQHHIQTAHQILGLVQGNGSVASLWAILSSSIFTAHYDIYRGLGLPGITAADGIKKENDGYVNNVDT